MMIWGHSPMNGMTTMERMIKKSMTCFLMRLEAFECYILHSQLIYLKWLEL